MPRTRSAPRNPKGTARLVIGGDAYDLRLGFSEIADADEHLGRSLIMAMQEQPSNFHLIRTAFYFAVRERAPEVRSVKQAGKLLEGADFGAVGEALQAAMRASGLIPDEDDEDAVGEGEEGEA